MLEQLESLGRLVSQRNRALFSPESHLATVIVKKYLHENKTVGAKEDPVAYWEKRQEVWLALEKLATVCPVLSSYHHFFWKCLCLPV